MALVSVKPDAVQKHMFRVMDLEERIYELMPDNIKAHTHVLPASQAR